MSDELDRRLDEALGSLRAADGGDDRWEALAQRIEGRLDEALPDLDVTAPPEFTDEDATRGSHLQAVPAPRPVRASRIPAMSGLALAAVVLIGVGITAVVVTQRVADQELAAASPAIQESAMAEQPSAVAPEAMPAPPPQRGWGAPGSEAFDRGAAEPAEMVELDRAGDGVGARARSPMRTSGSLGGTAMAGSEGWSPTVGEIGQGDRQEEASENVEEGALAGIDRETRRCRGAASSVRVELLVSRRGEVLSVQIPPPIAGTTQGTCIARALRGVALAPSSGRVERVVVVLPLSADAPLARRVAD